MQPGDKRSHCDIKGRQENFIYSGRCEGEGLNLDKEQAACQDLFTHAQIMNTLVAKADRALGIRLPVTSDPSHLFVD